MMVHLNNEMANRHFTPAATLMFILLFPTQSSPDQRVIGPPQPIAAVVGDDITLPCHLEPAMSASDKTVEWTRSGLEPRFVYVWRDGVELESKKHPSYRERTSVSISGLGHGDISLKLSRVKLSDEGKYICHVPNLPQSFAELFVGFVSVPVISGININNRAVVLECESKGWYPEPEVLWLDGEGNLLSAGPTETVRGPDDLYTVSSRVTVEKRHSNSFTCRVQQNKTNHTREAHIDISGDFSSAVCIGLWLISMAFILCSLTAAFVWWKWKHRSEDRRNVRAVVPMLDCDSSTLK
ncbi:butyrophilin subfamily 1 member A1 [Lates calcarifer]|uniref:Butyrophilin subfamily 1 member A1 n=1 Tax=Lates calcarifer TaxID=8187 RepID=A0AAJ8AYD3_LATCA|nr:butyrophilin subfamily 1 member A1 [Lates calcarifer]XP_050923000.1 butyrophilin subfamily 1 member A1 [Lates calcarifer]XP_050923001.1 butyrophilin subfamily 1 member A1 [Lates calcarifer]